MAEVPAPEYKQDSGDTEGQALPEGGASQVNSTTEDAALNDVQAATPQFANPGEEEDILSPQSERDKILFGDPSPTAEAPQGSQVAGSMLGDSPAPPRDIHQWLPDLAKAAQDPHAPAKVKSLFRLIMFHLQKHQSENS